MLLRFSTTWICKRLSTIIHSILRKMLIFKVHFFHRNLGIAVQLLFIKHAHIQNSTYITTLSYHCNITSKYYTLMWIQYLLVYPWKWLELSDQIMNQWGAHNEKMIHFRVHVSYISYNVDYLRLHHHLHLCCQNCHPFV